MKRYIIYFSFMLLYILSGCSDEPMTQHFGETTTEKFQTSGDGFLSLPSKDALQDAIEQGTMTRSTISSFVENGEFTSLLDEVSSNAPCLDELTTEEKDTILSQHLTYYEAFGYEDLVPNENFAKLLNWKGEILVDDSLYRITPIGTFCTSDATPVGSQKIESLYQQILQKDSLAFNDSTYIKLTDNVLLYNSFPEYKLEGTSLESRASTEVPLKHYASNKSNGWVWKKLSNLLGDRSTKHYEYLHKKRVNGSLYDYNYGVYAESGAFVSASRKRGGFFRKINGWKDIDAQELEIVCKDLSFVLDYNVPYTLTFPSNLQLVSTSNYVQTNLSEKPLRAIDILGYDVPAKAFYSTLKGTAPQILNMVRKELNRNKELNRDKIPDDIEVIRILTPTKCYTKILECKTSEKNSSKLRKVFNHSWQFYISNNIINNPLKLKSAADFFTNVKSIPVKHIESGRVILLSKIDGSWGGLVIDKNYQGIDEHIYR